MEDGNLLETVLNAYNQKYKDEAETGEQNNNRWSQRSTSDEALAGAAHSGNQQVDRIAASHEIDANENKCHQKGTELSSRTNLLTKKRMAPKKPRRKAPAGNTVSTMLMADLDLGEPLNIQSIMDSVTANAEEKADSDEISLAQVAEIACAEVAGKENDSNNNPNKLQDEVAQPSLADFPRTPHSTPDISNKEFAFNVEGRPSSSELEAHCEKLLASDTWFDDIEFSSDNDGRAMSDGCEIAQGNATDSDLPGLALPAGSCRQRCKTTSHCHNSPHLSLSGHSSDEEDTEKLDSASPLHNRRDALSQSVQSDLNFVGLKAKKLHRSVSTKIKDKRHFFTIDDKNMRKEFGQKLDNVASNAKAKLRQFKKNKLKAMRAQNGDQTEASRGNSAKPSPINGYTGNRDGGGDKQSDDEEDVENRKNSTNSGSSVASLGGGDKADGVGHQRVLRRGWLKKQGGMIKTWNERWFVLKGDRLFYYKDKEESKLLGVIPLHGNRVIEHPVRVGESNKFFFEIIPGGERENLTKNHNTYMMSVNSHAEAEEWIRALRKVISTPPGGGIFGQELNRTIKYDDQIERKLPPGERRQNRQAPYIIEACCEFIKKNGGYLEEGLFRLPGQANDVKILQDSFDMGERPSFVKSTDTHTVASLMKSFLRELPEPLVPYDLYTPLIDAVKLANPASSLPLRSLSSPSTPEGVETQASTNEACDLIKKQLELLPRENFKVLRYLCRFLDEVQQHSKRNKMDIDNLALMFGPNIIRSRKEEPMTMMSHATYVQCIMSEFIRNHKYLFPDDETSAVPASSIPDVAADAASRQIQDENLLSSPSTSSHRHNVFTDTVVSTNTAQTTSTDGFNTMTTQTTTSPPGTIGIRHITDDSGTGSLGPTPDNTSRRTVGAQPPHLVAMKSRPKPTSAIIEEGQLGEQALPSGTTPAMRPPVPKKPPKNLANSDVDRRDSFYDNVTQSSESNSAVNAAKKRYRGEQSQAPPKSQKQWRPSESGLPHGNMDGSGSQRSSYVNQTSPGVSSQRSSTNAVAGSSVHSLRSYDIDTLPYSPTMSVQDASEQQRFQGRVDGEVSSKGPKPPVRKRRSKKSASSSARNLPLQASNSHCITDEESNTESIAQDDSRSMLSSRQGSVSSINDPSISRSHGVHNNPIKPRGRPPPPPYPVGHPRAKASAEGYTQPSYEELQEDVRILQEKLVRQSHEYVARAKYMEDQLLRQIQELRFSTSVNFEASYRLEPDRYSQASEVEAPPRQYWKTGPSSNLNGDTLSYMESIPDTASEALHYDPNTQRYDLESKQEGLKEPKTVEDRLHHLQKSVSEEKRLRQMAEIQLKNEKRARLAAEERNEQLQKEMREFFYTFGSMFSNSDTSSVQ